jgi:hypothetical protein
MISRYAGLSASETAGRPSGAACLRLRLPSGSRGDREQEHAASHRPRNLFQAVPSEAPLTGPLPQPQALALQVQI